MIVLCYLPFASLFTFNSSKSPSLSFSNCNFDFLAFLLSSGLNTSWYYSLDPAWSSKWTFSKMFPTTIPYTFFGSRIPITWWSNVRVLSLGHWWQIMFTNFFQRLLQGYKYYVLGYYLSSYLHLKRRPVYLSIHNVSETGFCLRLQVKLSRFTWRRRQNPVSETLCFER
jgi:hypothetical protein